MRHSPLADLHAGFGVVIVLLLLSVVMVVLIAKPWKSRPGKDRQGSLITDVPPKFDGKWRKARLQRRRYLRRSAIRGWSGGATGAVVGGMWAAGAYDVHGDGDTTDTDTGGGDNGGGCGGAGGCGGGGCGGGGCGGG